MINCDICGTLHETTACPSCSGIRVPYCKVVRSITFDEVGAMQAEIERLRGENEALKAEGEEVKRLRARNAALERVLIAAERHRLHRTFSVQEELDEALADARKVSE